MKICYRATFKGPLFDGRGHKHHVSVPVSITVEVFQRTDQRWHLRTVENGRVWKEIAATPNAGAAMRNTELIFSELVRPWFAVCADDGRPLPDGVATHYKLKKHEKPMHATLKPNKHEQNARSICGARVAGNTGPVQIAAVTCDRCRAILRDIRKELQCKSPPEMPASSN